MQVNLRNPNIQVLLHKVVDRTTAAGSAPVTSTNAPTSGANLSVTASGSLTSNIYDLTPWLGEGSQVRVQKSVREPAGAFSISFADKLDSGLKDTLYALIEPMDLIEIRFAGDAWKYAGRAQLPIMMRGFVSDIERRQSMGSDGKPRRTVEVVGHDYQKILQLIQIFNIPTSPDSADLISSFPLFSKYGEAFNVQKSTAFVLAAFNSIVNPYISNMQQAVSSSAAALLEIATDIQVPDAVVSVQLGAFNSGTVQQLLEEYLDIGPFNEFFVEDRDAGAWGPAGPYAVYRPVPFLDATQRSPLQPVAGSVTTGVSPSGIFAPTANCVTIKSDSIVSISARRNDANVANYYWVDAPRFSMNYDDPSKMMANFSALQDSSPYYVQDYGNVNPSLYGTRKLEVATQQGGASETNSGNGTPAGDNRWKNQNSFLDWITKRRNLLIQLNRDNVVLESGSMHLKGNENIKAGSYVQVNYGATSNNALGGIQSIHYAYSVTHVYEPFGNYFTEVEYDRGTNFIDRITQSQGGVPAYYAEKLQPQ
ncbi:hypothetical protein EOS_33070 [Caballeronia mineralivorans PML1(12)]|uniref:Uncharacterized protein n=1 Tax=Caballeronia mineralivorans PML1(12) TaxID=908627 RepID=A0A0J1CMG8_9BURK|nr:hypothetical protein [Caballeronia mineralivorans]KLU21975.1 hypothetical protein EOS_33070 [Caballeronia mineralivorans PML1(12)]